MDDEEKDEDYNWVEYGDHDNRNQIDLEGKDILALCIASLQTVFLPILILSAFLVVISLIIGFFF